MPTYQNLDALHHRYSATFSLSIPQRARSHLGTMQPASTTKNDSPSRNPPHPVPSITSFCLRSAAAFDEIPRSCSCGAAVPTRTRSNRLADVDNITAQVRAAQPAPSCLSVTSVVVAQTPKVQCCVSRAVKFVVRRIYTRYGSQDAGIGKPSGKRGQEAGITPLSERTLIG